MIGTRSKRTSARLPSVPPVHQRLTEISRSPGPLDHVSWTFPTAPTPLMPHAPGNCGRFAPISDGLKTGVNTRLGWLSDQDSNLNRLNSNLVEERAVIAVRRHAAGVGLAGIRRRIDTPL